MKVSRGILIKIKDGIIVAGGIYMIVWSILEKKYGLLYVYAVLAILFFSAIICIYIVDKRKGRE
jgi:Flp pilus assembly protein TadB